MRMSISALWEFLKGVEYFQAGAAEIFVISGYDDQIVPASRGGDIAIFDGHPKAGFFEQYLLLGPDVRDGNIESMDAPMHRLDQTPEPRLQRLSLPAFPAAHPVSQLGNRNCARVATVFFMSQPCDDPFVAIAFCRLAQHV